MRHDMARVVIERPRHGSSWRSAKTGKRLHRSEYELDDHGSNRHPISRYRQYDNYKTFSDLLGPLRGFLRKAVGRHWDDVYSELSKNLDRRGTSGSHIWDHVLMEVDTHAWMGEDGKIYHKLRYGSVIEISGLYVHPVTGILCYVQEISYRTRYRQVGAKERLKLIRELEVLGLWTKTKGESNKLVVDFKIIDSLHVMERIKGLWFIHEFAYYDLDKVCAFTNDKGEIYYSTRRKRYPDGPDRYKVLTRQLGRKERDRFLAAK